MSLVSSDFIVQRGFVDIHVPVLVSTGFTFVFSRPIIYAQEMSHHLFGKKESWCIRYEARSRERSSPGVLACETPKR